MPPLVDGRTRLFAEVSCVQDVQYVRHVTETIGGKIWRRGRDLNSRMSYPISGFQDRHVRPLRHPSAPRVLVPNYHELCRFRQNLLYSPHIGMKCLGNQYRSVRLLKVFKDSHQRSSDCQAGAV